jgi:hypothetical protein
MFATILRVVTVLAMFMSTSPSEAQFAKYIFVVIGAVGGAIIYEGTSKSEAQEVHDDNPGSKILTKPNECPGGGDDCW